MDIHNEIHLSNIQNILAVFPGDAEPGPRAFFHFSVPIVCRLAVAVSTANDSGLDWCVSDGARDCKTQIVMWYAMSTTIRFLEWKIREGGVGGRR